MLILYFLNEKQTTVFFAKIMKSKTVIYIYELLCTNIALFIFANRSISLKTQISNSSFFMVIINTNTCENFYIKLI